MFQEASKDTLEQARQAAAYLHGKRRALGLDEPTAARLDTLAADIAMELEDRAAPKTTAAARPADRQLRGENVANGFPESSQGISRRRVY